MIIIIIRNQETPTAPNNKMKEPKDKAKMKLKNRKETRSINSKALKITTEDRIEEKDKTKDKTSKRIVTTTKER